jgi:hypothetical protein
MTVSQPADDYPQEKTLQIGDGLRKAIDRGIAESRFGVVVLSMRFLEKPWPQWELDGLVSRMNAGKLVLLPVWLDVTSEEINSLAPSLANMVAAKASLGVGPVADAIAARVRSVSVDSEAASAAPPPRRSESAEHLSSVEPRPVRGADERAMPTPPRSSPKIHSALQSVAQFVIRSENSVDPY